MIPRNSRDGRLSIRDVGVPASDIPASSGLLRQFFGVAGNDLYRADVRGVGESVVQDGFEGGPSSTWISIGNRTTFPNVGELAYGGSYVMRLEQGNTQQDQVYEVVAGELQAVPVDFYLRSDIDSPPGGAANRLQLFAQAFDSLDTPITSLVGLAYVNQEEVGSTWSSFSSIRTDLVGIPYVTPAGTVKVRFTLRLQTAAGFSGALWIDNFYGGGSASRDFNVLENGEVVDAGDFLTYDTYINAVLTSTGDIFSTGWQPGFSPALLSKDTQSFTFVGQAGSTNTVYGILQRVGMDPPTYDQIAAGLDGEGNPALGVGSTTAYFNQTMNLTITRNLGVLTPIFDVYIGLTAATIPVTAHYGLLLEPPPGKGYVIVGDLPAPEGSMLLQLPITVVNGDVIEYDLNNRPSSKVVTVLPNGVRSAV